MEVTKHSVKNGWCKRSSQGSYFRYDYQTWLKWVSLYRQFDSCLERDNPSDEIRFVGTSRVTFFLGSTPRPCVWPGLPTCQNVATEWAVWNAPNLYYKYALCANPVFNSFNYIASIFVAFEFRKKMLSCKSRGFRIIATQHLAQHTHTHRALWCAAHAALFHVQRERE